MTQRKLIDAIDGINIYQNDLNLVRNQWFNDNLINYKIALMKEELSFEDILIVDAIGYAMLMLYGSEDILEPLEAKNYKHIICVMNDNDNFSVAGSGKHWTMAYFNIPTKKVYIYDSIGSLYAIYMEETVKKFNEYFNIQFKHIISKCPRQMNTIDCGPHVLCNIYAVHKLITSKAEKFDVLEEVTTPEKIRKELYERLTSLKKE